jgi:hypothetical protein
MEVAFSYFKVFAHSAAGRAVNKMKSNEQGMPYNRYQPLCRRSLFVVSWFHGFTPVSTLALAGSGVCTLTFGRIRQGARTMQAEGVRGSLRRGVRGSSRVGCQFGCEVSFQLRCY